MNWPQIDCLHERIRWASSWTNKFTELLPLLIKICFPLFPPRWLFSFHPMRMFACRRSFQLADDFAFGCFSQFFAPSACILIKRFQDEKVPRASYFFFSWKIITRKFWMDSRARRKLADSISHSLEIIRNPCACFLWGFLGNRSSKGLALSFFFHHFDQDGDTFYYFLSWVDCWDYFEKTFPAEGAASLFNEPMIRWTNAWIDETSKRTFFFAWRVGKRADELVFW